MLAGGALLGTLAGVLLTPDSGADPLLWLMFLTALAALVAVILTLRREKRMGL